MEEGDEIGRWRMTTATLSDSGRTRSRHVARTARPRIHIGRFGIGSVGLLTVLIAAWGGILPFVGPSFGYSADGTGSWHWNLAHALLSLAPGAVGVLVGAVILAETRGVVVGRGRFALTMVGILGVLSGAWFVVGPLAWPVITTQGAYFVHAAPLRNLANQAGYSLGTGVILALCGGFAIGWASRHQPKATTVLPAATSDADAAPVVTPAAV
jgi:hypothetical protein